MNPEEYYTPTPKKGDLVLGRFPLREKPLALRETRMRPCVVLEVKTDETLRSPNNPQGLVLVVIPTTTAKRLRAGRVDITDERNLARANLQEGERQLASTDVRYHLPFSSRFFRIRTWNGVRAVLVVDSLSEKLMEEIERRTARYTQDLHLLPLQQFKWHRGIRAKMKHIRMRPRLPLKKPLRPAPPAPENGRDYLEIK